jgi:general stress protein 26
MTAMELTGADAIARVKTLVEEMDLAMLTTVDAAGNHVARPMSTRRMDDAGDLWFFTIAPSEKTEEVASDEHVGLTYIDAKARRYVSIAGVARVVDDPGRMHELYDDELDVWFENGLATPGIALLKITPKECEFWEPAQSRLAAAAKSLVGQGGDGDEVRHGRVTC